MKDTETLKLELEKCTTDARTKEASNRALKEKIVELFVEASTRAEEKRKLQQELEETRRRLAVSEASSSWYRNKLYEFQASESIAERAHRAEIRVYRDILKERRAALTDLTERYKQLNLLYDEMMSSSERSNNKLSEKLQQTSFDSAQAMKIQEILDGFEGRLSPIPKADEESELYSKKWNTGNEHLIQELLSSQQERANLHADLLRLHYQINSILIHRKILAPKNEEHLESRLQVQESGNKWTVWRESSEESTRSKSSELSLDEGYADGSLLSSGSSDLPSAPPNDSEIVKSALDVLSRSENFMTPLEISVQELALKMQRGSARCFNFPISDHP